MPFGLFSHWMVMSSVAKIKVYFHRPSKCDLFVYFKVKCYNFNFNHLFLLNLLTSIKKNPFLTHEASFSYKSIAI